MRRVVQLGALAIVLLAVVVAAPSEAASTFSASADGQLVRVLLRLEPAIIQADLLDPGALSTQASLTSFGESVAFASNPYPGSLPVSLPGTVAGLLGSSLPPELAPVLRIPDYPLYVSSSYPAQPSVRGQVGVATLEANSGADESRSSAGDGVNRTEAKVSVDGDDVVHARATTELATIDAGPLLQLSGLRATAEATRTPDGQVERHTTFSIASLSILGQQVRWTPDGLELVGVHLPVGSQALDPLDALLVALAQTGTSLRVLPKTSTPDGIVSAAIEITRQVPVPNVGTVTVVATLGRTQASVSNTARPTEAFDEPLPSGDLGLPLGGDTSSIDGFGEPLGGLPSPAAPRTGATPPVGDQRPIRSLVASETDAGDFYPVLVVAAALLAVSSTLFRRLGGRPVWSS